MTAHRPLRLASALLMSVAVSGCASMTPSPAEEGILAELEPGGTVYTQRDIVRMKAHNALDVLERSRSHLKMDRARTGQVVRMTHRGLTTLELSPEIMLVVDGARAARPEQMLRSIPARSILFIQILSGREASSRFGSQAGNGVVLVRTSAH